MQELTKEEIIKVEGGNLFYDAGRAVGRDIGSSSDDDDSNDSTPSFGRDGAHFG